MLNMSNSEKGHWDMGGGYFQGSRSKGSQRRQPLCFTRGKALATAMVGCRACLASPSFWAVSPKHECIPFTAKGPPPLELLDETPSSAAFALQGGATVGNRKGRAKASSILNNVYPSPTVSVSHPGLLEKEPHVVAWGCLTGKHPHTCPSRPGLANNEE